VDLLRWWRSALACGDDACDCARPHVPRGHSKLVLTLGWALLLLGVLGLFLPLLPGIPLFIAGLVILSRQYEWARGLLERTRRLIPAAAGKLRQVRRAAGLGT
jgi:Putative transmembrane protein (PGPGW)